MKMGSFGVCDSDLVGFEVIRGLRYSSGVDHVHLSGHLRGHLRKRGRFNLNPNL